MISSTSDKQKEIRFKLSPQMSSLCLPPPLLLLPDSSFNVRNKNHKILLIMKHGYFYNSICIIKRKTLQDFFFEEITKSS